MTFLAHYASFLLNTVTIVVAIIIILLTIVALASKNKLQADGKLHIKKLNDHFDNVADHINQEILSKKDYKQLQKQQKKDDKSDKKPKNRLFVLHFNGDVRANQVEQLRREITAVLTVATVKDEVLICLESPGGVVHGYGLAASQLQRIREKHIPLTVAVDKVAASGGYMMACVADKILAAPFAIIGSIGVVMQLPNFNKLLDKNNIDYEILTAGDFKRTLTMFGKNTDKGREKMQQEIDATQVLFKGFISQNRPEVNIEEVATGEHWFATQALKLQLVDTIITSDDYLLQASKKVDVFMIKTATKKSLLQKLGKSASLSVDGVMSKILGNQLT
jgi:serine protease SohB